MIKGKGRHTGKREIYQDPSGNAMRSDALLLSVLSNSGMNIIALGTPNRLERKLNIPGLTL